MNYLIFGSLLHITPMTYYELFDIWITFTYLSNPIKQQKSQVKAKCLRCNTLVSGVTLTPLYRGRVTPKTKQQKISRDFKMEGPNAEKKYHEPGKTHESNVKLRF